MARRSRAIKNWVPYQITKLFGAGNTKIIFFESLPTASFQKNYFYNENCLATAPS
jgi:hypothetical protein